MELTKLAEIILLQMEALFVLQEIDEKWRLQEPRTVSLLEEIYSDRQAKFSSISPVMRLGTSLSMLFLPTAFTLQSTEDEIQVIKRGLVSDRYSVRIIGDELRARNVLSTFRHSIAHMPEFMSGVETPNVAFDEGILCCRGRKVKLVFDNEGGYINFVIDLRTLVRATAGRILDQERAGSPHQSAGRQSDTTETL